MPTARLGSERDRPALLVEALVNPCGVESASFCVVDSEGEVRARKALTVVVRVVNLDDDGAKNAREDTICLTAS